MRNKDHIRIGNTDSGGHALLCLHCGEIYVPSLPISVNMFLVLSKQFGREHKACPCPATGPLESKDLLRKAELRHLANIERKGSA